MTLSRSREFILQRNLGVLFLLACILIFSLKVPEAEIYAATDSMSYVEGANAFIEYGGYVHLNDPETVRTWNTPFYPIFIAANIIVFGEDAAIQAVLVWQMLFLFLTAWLIYRIVAPFSPMAALVAQIIVLFNPNSLATAFLIQTETLFTLILTLAVFLFFRPGRKISLGRGALIGLLLGLGAMTRPVLFYALLVLPFIFPFLGLVSDGWKARREWLKRDVMAGIAATLAMSLVVLPWVWRNHQETGVATFVSNGGAYLWDNVSEIYQANDNPLLAEWPSMMARSRDDATGPALPSGELPETVISQAMSTAALAEIRRQPAMDLVRAEIYSIIQLFLSGGSSNVTRLFGLEPGNFAFNTFNKARTMTGLLKGVVTIFKETPGAYFVVHITPILTAIILRGLALLGIIELVRRKDWHMLAICSGVLLYFTSFCLFYGQSRFRVPLEPVLAILSGFGFVYLITVWRKIRSR
jgi:hypothetical protein